MLTHGHEDHIGAVPVPAAAAARTSRWSAPSSPWRWSQAKCREHRISPAHLSRSRRVRRSGSARSTCEFFAVNHSIPDALAVAVRTTAGLVLHTGDFKLDQLPLDGRLTDLRGVRPARRRGRRPVPGRLDQRRGARASPPPEREIGPVLDRVFGSGRAPGHRGLLRLARAPGAADPRRRRAHGRKVAFVGRSMVRNMGIAKDLGYLRVPDGRADRAARRSTTCPRTRWC